MSISKSILGMNARNYLYIRTYNKRQYKLIADDKLETKRRLMKAKVPTTQLIAQFKTLQDVRDCNWNALPERFVLKPSHGYGGRGIRVIKKWSGDGGVDVKGHPIGFAELEADIFGALDGAHSLNNLPDTAFLEECIEIHPFFKKYTTTKGVPDIRVIVCNKIPVMAMLRLPTIYSDGKANLHLGALGVGIDIRTGITTFGVIKGQPTTIIPGRKTKVQGIKIPNWQQILEIAVQAQITSKLGFVGIDIVLDANRGPLVLEVNARPGLSIQVANRDSLRTRLERVEHLTIDSVEEGVELAQRLFADKSLAAVKVADRLLGVIEKVTIYGDSKKKTVRAKIDTGAYRTSIDADLVHELGLDKHHKFVHVRSGSGRQRRHTVKLNFKLKDKKIKTIATYTERSHLRFPIIIGRRDMKGFFVDPSNIPEGVTVR